MCAATRMSFSGERWPVPARTGAVLLLLTLLTLCITTHGCSPKSIRKDYEIPLEGTTFSFDQGTYPSQLGLFPQYHIGPGDVLDVLVQIQRQKTDTFPITLYHTVSVNFVDVPELNQTQEVLPNGKIMLPYVGGVEVLGKTPEELQAALKREYASVLREPEIYVTLPDFNARIEQLRRDLHTAPRGLSKLVNVRPDGHATFPLIGEFLVAGKSIEKANEMIQDAYADYLPGMRVDLFLHERSGSVVYMVGQLDKPGTYEISQPITVLQAITMAGGYTNEAELRNVIVFREHEERRIARSVNLKKLLKGNRKSSVFFVKPEDIVFVPRTRIASLAQLMREISDIALFRGWSVSRSYGDED